MPPHCAISAVQVQDVWRQSRRNQERLWRKGFV